MLNSLASKSFWQIRLPLLLLSMIWVTGLSACSTPQAVGQATVAPQQPPAHPVLPRPDPLNLEEFQVQVQPAIGNSPPLVTMTFDSYSSVLKDLGSSATRICQDSWLLDYYEGKNNGVKPPNWCVLPPLVLPDPKSK